MNNNFKIDDFILEVPTIERKEDAIDYINEFYEYNSGINGTGSLDRYLKEKTYEKWLEKLEKDYNTIKNEDRVPARTYFLIRKKDNKIIGMINIRLELNEYLRTEGGHIGYSIRPTERRKGYNKINLYLGLEICKKYGIKEVLLFCEKDNIASGKTIKSVGGIFKEEFLNEENIVMEKYLIDVNTVLFNFNI